MKQSWNNFFYQSSPDKDACDARKQTNDGRSDAFPQTRLFLILLSLHFLNCLILAIMLSSVIQKVTPYL